MHIKEKQKQEKKINWKMPAIIIFSLIIILMYSLFGYLPVVGKYIADFNLSKYCGEKIDSYYDILNNQYNGTDKKGNHLVYYLNENTLFHENYNNQILVQINEKYLSFVAEAANDKIEYPADLYAWVKINTNDTARTYVKLYVLNVREKVSIGVEDSKERIVEIVRELVEYLDVNCTALQVNYENKTGSFSLVCDFGKKPVDYNQLIKYIELQTEDFWSQDYKEWKNAD
ncbi:MAG TPA: hypothetical protein PLI19_03845 [Erysipelotrichaceae bacterium]|nr:hypothetical protein [Erysipelotrichaceae bacterium]HQB32447.1 hypothetical protein [Erysipelotrichaceae bacterium]